MPKICHNGPQLAILGHLAEDELDLKNPNLVFIPYSDYDRPPSRTLRKRSTVVTFSDEFYSTVLKFQAWHREKHGKRFNISRFIEQELSRKILQLSGMTHDPRTTDIWGVAMENLTGDTYLVTHEQARELQAKGRIRFELGECVSYAKGGKVVGRVPLKTDMKKRSLKDTYQILEGGDYDDWI